MESKIYHNGKSVRAFIDVWLEPNTVVYKLYICLSLLGSLSEYYVSIA